MYCTTGKLYNTTENSEKINPISPDFGAPHFQRLVFSPQMRRYVIILCACGITVTLCLPTWKSFCTGVCDDVGRRSIFGILNAFLRHHMQLQELHAFKIKLVRFLVYPV